MSDYVNALERILDQAEKALHDEPVLSIEDQAVASALGLSIKHIRLGNIVAICRVALDR